ncbi:MAG TPA: hypothetical protein VF230_16535 [Acidimicrobiales bacterium]
MRLRIATGAAVGVAAAVVFVSAALAYTFEGPKTWLPNWSADSTFAVWYSATMGAKGSSGYQSRITFIDNSGGGWHWSHTDTLPNTTTFNYDSGYYKAHCKNNDSVSYIATCWTN